MLVPDFINRSVIMLHTKINTTWKRKIMYDFFYTSIQGVNSRFFKAVLRKQWINYKRKFLFVCSLQRAGRHTGFDPCTDWEIRFKKGPQTSRLTSKRLHTSPVCSELTLRKNLLELTFSREVKKKHKCFSKVSWSSHRCRRKLLGFCILDRKSKHLRQEVKAS